MIELSVEGPTVLVSELTNETELDFALAHKVLEDHDYRKFYAGRPRGRELILDNSVHELGEPLSAKALLVAARLVHAEYVIAPDQLDSFEATLGWFAETMSVFEGQFTQVAAVLVGETPEQRRTFLRSTTGAAMLCLPFRRPRLSWFLEHFTDIVEWRRLHLLGVNTIQELHTFAALAAHMPSHKWSVDTAKALKFGLMGKQISRLENLRGAPIPSKQLLEITSVSTEQSRMVRANMQYLRRVLAHGDGPIADAAVGF